MSDDSDFELMDQIVESESKKFFERTGIDAKSKNATNNANSSQEECIRQEWGHGPGVPVEANLNGQNQQQIYQAGPSNGVKSASQHPPPRSSFPPPGNPNAVGSMSRGSSDGCPSQLLCAAGATGPAIGMSSQWDCMARENNPPRQYFRKQTAECQRPPYMQNMPGQSRSRRMSVEEEEGLRRQIREYQKQINDYQVQLAVKDDEVEEVQELKRGLNKVKADNKALQSQLHNLQRAQLSNTEPPQTDIPERAPKRRKQDGTMAGSRTPLHPSKDLVQAENCALETATRAIPKKSHGIDNGRSARQAVLDEIWGSPSMEVFSLLDLGRKIDQGADLSFDFTLDLALLRNYALQLMELKRIPMQSLVQSSIELVSSIIPHALSPERKHSDAEEKTINAVKLATQVLEVLSNLVNGVNHPEANLGMGIGDGCSIDIAGVVDLLGCLVAREDSWVWRTAEEEEVFCAAVVKLAWALACCPGDIVTPEIWRLLLLRGFLEQNLKAADDAAKICTLDILLSGKHQFSGVDEVNKKVLVGVLECISCSGHTPSGAPCNGGSGAAGRDRVGFELACRKAFQFVAECMLWNRIDCIHFLVDGNKSQGFAGLVPRLCERMTATVESLEKLENKARKERSIAIRQHVGLLLEGIRIVQCLMKIDTVEVCVLQSLNEGVGRDVFCILFSKLQGLGADRLKFVADEVLPLRLPGWVFALGTNRLESVMREGRPISMLTSLANKIFARLAHISKETANVDKG